ncbi:MAG TPA: hypothetical protein PLF21_02920 [Exilispira sp.]|nr:hypothetical protein [Exilispira sp.]
MKQVEMIVKIISEVAHFILQEDPNRMVISLHKEKDGIHLAILDDKKRSKKEIENLKRTISIGQRPELSGYYGNLAGNNLLGEARLDLIGWQVKYIDLNETRDGLKIDIWVGSEDFDKDKFNIPKK